MNFTYGLELEFADVRYGQPLPAGCSWNRQDGTIVNSNGVANCPNGCHWPWGGEINTRPTSTIDEQMVVVNEILEMLNPPPVVNYRCNLHIHVGVRDLKNDLPKLKLLIKYLDENQSEVFHKVDPIPIPQREDFDSEESYKGARRRYRRRLKSHQSVLTPEQVQRMLSGENPLELYLAHFRTDRRGRPQKQLHQRCGINLRSLWENDETIEFRHFPGSDNLIEIRSALVWCEQFLSHALTDGMPASQIWESVGKSLSFPTFRPYCHDLETIYALTSYRLRPEMIQQNLRELGLASL